MCLSKQHNFLSLTFHFFHSSFHTSICSYFLSYLFSSFTGTHVNYHTMNSSTQDLESKCGSTGTLPDIQKPKVYRIRWLILILFVFFSASNAMQWIQYSIISDVIRTYYGVSTEWVNWTSLIYMTLYIPFIFPGSYLLEKLVSNYVP